MADLYKTHKKKSKMWEKESFKTIFYTFFVAFKFLDKIVYFMSSK